MRILYFYQYFTTPNGCWGTRAYEFARRWVSAGDSVTVVTSVYDKSDLKPTRWISRFDVDGIDVRVMNIRLSNKHGILLRLVTFAAYALMASWYGLTMRSDVVIASSGPITVGIPGLVARYLRGRRFIFEVRDLWPEGAVQLGVVRNPIIIRVARWFERRCYRAASRVVVLSPGMADWIRDRHRLTNIDVVPNAADNDLVEAIRQPLALPDWAAGKRLVVYAGTLGLMDDCSQIIECARVLQETGSDGIEIALIGDGKERRALQARVEDLGLRNVHFVGLLPKAQVMTWLRAATCVVFVYKDVPLLATVSPNKLFDAFAAGLPVIQTTQGWIRELLEREHCGLTVPPCDPLALAQAIMRVTGDTSLRDEMAQNAQRLAKGDFDRDRLAARMHDVLAGGVRTT